ncbi:integrase [Desulfosporosinus sp. Tol-M]|nr:integrase [Desulfosporosinus sp. Tol-M]
MITDKELLAFRDGIFKPYFEKYIEFKRGKGEKVSHSTLIRLKALNESLNRYSNTLDIELDTVELLLKGKDTERETLRAMRVSDLRQFNAFLKTLGIHAYQISNKYMKKVHVAFKPYIFSAEELSKITEASDHLKPSRRSSNYLTAYPVLLRILIGTGMRIGEVLSLRIKDVDTINQLLVVYQSKNNVSRYVPMSDSLSVIILDYVSGLAHRHNSEQYLFVSPYTGTRYSYTAMKYMFKKIFAESGVRTPRGRLPRIHDIRHSFCTLSLDRMLDSGMDLYVAVPVLAAYVGHVNLRDTERYIHLTEHGYDEFVRREGALKTLIPEVDEL